MIYFFFSPFCPFAIMMDSSNTQTEFKCQNPDCSISSCRSCKKHGHPGFACNEVSDGIAKIDIPKEEYMKNKLSILLSSLLMTYFVSLNKLQTAENF